MKVEQLASVDLEQVQGGNSPALTSALRDMQQQLSTFNNNPRQNGYYQPPGAGYRVEYPQGFGANGNARSWQTRDNATGKLISQGTNPQ